MLRSLGIDIGSAGTQVVFSRLHFRRLGEDLTSRYVVVRRENVHRSPVRLTPYVGDHQIGSARTSALVGQAYQDARQCPGDIGTGAVILTGEALRRGNARQIADALAARCGDLVCASAGHHMEAMLAAYGSGAARASRDQQARVLNIGIGGGTTKLALLESGRVVATAALHVGGRLHVVDADGRLVRLDPAGRDHAARAGFSWPLGDTVEPAALDRVADEMAGMVIAAVSARPLPDQVRRLFLTEPIDDLGRVDSIIFSGGAAEYVYGREARDFGDFGRRLEAAIRARVAAGALPAVVAPTGERIHATVLGASEYSVQLSGNTSHTSRADALLPRRNLQVPRPGYTPGTPVDPDALARAIRRHLVAFDADNTSSEIVLSLDWTGVPSHERISETLSTFDESTNVAREGCPSTCAKTGIVAHGASPGSCSPRKSCGSGRYSTARSSGSRSASRSWTAHALASRLVPPLTAGRTHRRPMTSVRSARNGNPAEL